METDEERRSREWRERAWNMALFRMPATNETRDAVFLLVGALAIAGFTVWGILSLLSWIVG